MRRACERGGLLARLDEKLRSYYWQKGALPMFACVVGESSAASCHGSHVTCPPRAEIQARVSCAQPSSSRVRARAIWRMPAHLLRTRIEPIQRDASSLLMSRASPSLTLLDHCRGALPTLHAALLLRCHAVQRGPLAGGRRSHRSCQGSHRPGSGGGDRLTSCQVLNRATRYALQCLVLIGDDLSTDPHWQRMDYTVKSWTFDTLAPDLIEAISSASRMCTWVHMPLKEFPTRLTQLAICMSMHTMWRK